MDRTALSNRSVFAFASTRMAPSALPTMARWSPRWPVKRQLAFVLESIEWIRIKPKWRWPRRPEISSPEMSGNRAGLELARCPVALLAPERLQDQALRTNASCSRADVSTWYSKPLARDSMAVRGLWSSVPVEAAGIVWMMSSVEPSRPATWITSRLDCGGLDIGEGVNVTPSHGCLTSTAVSASVPGTPPRTFPPIRVPAPREPGVR